MHAQDPASESPAPARVDASRPLCVDLDGTLVAGDTLMESLLSLVKAAPLNALRLPLWAMHGLPTFKRRVAERVTVNAAALPYRPSMVQFLHQQKRSGRRLLLATASDHRVAEAVAEHLGLFDDVIATNGVVDDPSNLKGAAKLKAIRDRLGDGEFDYIGDSSADLPIWAGATRAYLVAPSRPLLDKARVLGNVAQVFDPHEARTTARALIRAIRPQQWIKNLLLAVPMFVGQQLPEPDLWLALVGAMVAFSLCASSVYVWNDLLDIPADRLHPTKRRRPFAAGLLSVPQGVAVGMALAGVGLGLAAALGAGFFGAVLVYLIAASGYSLWAKDKLIVDVLVLAALYTLRIIAGAYAIGVVASPWLLAFSMFIFLSLAFAKRYAELTLIASQDGERTHGRGYLVEDLGLIASVGPTSGYLAVLVFALYIHSEKVIQLYKKPEALWLICPLLLYWTTRLWFKAHRRTLVDDPLLFAMTDRVTYFVGAGIVVIALVANG